MPLPRFVHLHVHTHYSLLDGATRINALIERAKQYDMPAVAITDHGNLFGAIEFYTAAKAAGIKPIIGCETYLAAGGDRRQKDPVEGKEAYHLLLLAMNLQGYRNLIRLSSLGYTEGFYRKPRIDKNILAELSEGLLCTSTCIGGEIPQTFLNRDRAAAQTMAETYLKIFGPDRFFIELQDHSMPEQRTLNPELVDLANRLGVATIASNDVHYLEQDDVEAHDVLCCINTGKLITEENRFKFPTGEFYFKTTEQMAGLFPQWPEALDNTLRLADMCNLELDLSKRHAPVFRVPEEITNEQREKLTDADYLRKLVYAGAEERYGGSTGGQAASGTRQPISAELKERIDYELDVVISKGFASYFLIVWDCVRYAREHGIPVGARGSGCSSVIAYCLRISTPDPIRYGLYFERFMDPDRDEMPDIDLDICQNGRAEILEYVRGKYGHVAQIITFGTLKARAAIKDVARVLGLGFEESNELTKLIPTELKITLDKALKQEPELKKRYLADERIRRIIDISRRLEGVARNAGVHAAGVVVADQPLVNFLPLYKSAGQDALVTQFDGPTVEKVGLLKMDFLGLRTLTILERAKQLAEKRIGRTLDLEKIDLTDQRVYELFAHGDTKGVFQFESGGMRDVIMRMKPNRIEDLIAANALFRPGPMEYIPDYVERKHGKNWTTPHPIMTEVLQETYGIMVYQEQVSRLVNRLGGVELKAAFRLAKAISKKKTSMIEQMRAPFLDGCEKRGVARHTAEQVFEDILKFGGYAFNKAHSTGYALVAYQTAWMKTYFPVEFMAAVLTFEMSSTEKVAEYREACSDMGISIEPPDVNASEYEFVVDKAPPALALDGQHQATEGNGKNGHARRVGGIRFGLGAIKGVGEKAVAAIVAERSAGGPFRDLFDFCERIDLSCVNRGTIEAMVDAGAFDTTGAMRKALCLALDSAMTAGARAQSDRRAGQMALFGGPADTAPKAGGPRISTAEWSEAEMLRREKAVLGFYITKHPLASHQALLDACTNASIADLVKMPEGRLVTVGGIITNVRVLTTRQGKPMAVVTLEDLTGRTEAVVFSEKLNEFRPLLVADALVFIEGEVDRKREEPSIRTNNVIAADRAIEALAKLCILRVSSEPDVTSLLEVLRQHRGPCPVHLEVLSPEGVIAEVACGNGLRVACSGHLLGTLAEHYPQSHPRILGPSRRPIPLPKPSPPSPRPVAVPA